MLGNKARWCHDEEASFFFYICALYFNCIFFVQLFLLYNDYERMSAYVTYSTCKKNNGKHMKQVHLLPPTACMIYTSSKYVKNGRIPCMLRRRVYATQTSRYTPCIQFLISSCKLMLICLLQTQSEKRKTWIIFFFIHSFIHSHHSFNCN